MIFVKGNEKSTPYFKTTGKDDSVHTDECGFSRPLSFQETVSKVAEYQQDFQKSGVKEVVVRLNLSSIDPDRLKKEVVKENKEPSVRDLSEVKIKQK